MELTATNLQDVLSEIDDLRVHMIELSRLHGLSGSKTVHCSQKLDQLIFYVQLLRKS